MTEILIYICSGFLESGKTTFIKDTISDPEFNSDDPTTLIICLEQGEVEYEDEFLKKHDTSIEYLDSYTELTNEKLNEFYKKYKPTQIFIEWNGMEPLTEFIKMPLDAKFVLVQIITTIDANTFNAYMSNMRQIMAEQMKYSELIIFNRCQPGSSKNALRGNVKALNKRAFISYEGEFGERVQLQEEELPFDINAPIIDINDDDYGIWYMDALEHPEKYDKKKIRIRGMYLSPIPGYKQSFNMGRQAMTCCAEDLQNVAFTVTGVRVDQLTLNQWLEIEGDLKMVPVDDEEYTLVLYATKARTYNPPLDPLVYFS